VTEATTRSVSDFSESEIAAILLEIGQPKFRARQIQEWLWTHLAVSWDQMTNLPKGLRQDLAERWEVGVPAVAEEQVSQDGTAKWAFQDAAGRRYESVMIPDDDRRTACISTQVGCAMGCAFCRTAQMGFLRNLSNGEILQQVAHVKRWLRDRNEPPLSNIVFMGMGEPLDNLDNVAQAIRVLSDPAGMNFPMSQITVSTVGRIDGLKKLGTLGWINLRIAISLNAANDKLRDELMPVNKGMPLADLKQALLDYPMTSRGRYLIEYVLIKGVNDSMADADAVAAFCAGLRCIVNVIPYNPQRFASFETPSDDTVLAFMMRLKEHKVFVKRRITHGREMMGACGQLGNPEIRRKPVPITVTR